MASKDTLQQLFQVAKASLYFEGSTDEEIWSACLTQQDRSDEDIKIAIQNIYAQDKAISEASEQKKAKQEQQKKDLDLMRQNETSEREANHHEADSMLDDFFNL